MPRNKQTSHKANSIRGSAAAKASAGRPSKAVPLGADESTRRAKIARTIRRRASTYRHLATRAGYIGGFNVELASGGDALCSLVSLRDVKRLARFVPACAANRFESKLQQTNRNAVLQEALPPSALEAARHHVEAMLRAVMNDAVFRGVETSRLRVSPAIMYSALRKYIGRLDFPGAEPTRALLESAGAIDGSEDAETALESTAAETRESYKESVRKHNRSVAKSVA